MKRIENKDAFTLIELVVTMLIVGLLASIAVPASTNLYTNAQISATGKEMKNIQLAIMGDAQQGLMGFRDHIGDLPANLTELFDNTVAAYPGFNNYTQRGWNGPYIEDRDSDGDGRAEVLDDAWGNPYVYVQAAGTLTSWGPDQAAGGGDDIVLNID